MSVVYFLLLVGVLVFIHELGHFIAAKSLHFKVLRFSIGFGRPLLRVRGRETEYQLALIPLGGYVKILGEDTSDDIPPELARRSFNAQPIWRRLIVVFAGPAANLILPIFIYFIFFAGQSELPAAVVGDVLADSPAAHAGIEPGDRVLAIDGEGVRYWEELERLVQNSVGKELRLKIRRGERVFEKYIRPVEQTSRSRDGVSKRAGQIGITQAPFPPVVGVIDPSSPAASGTDGLRTGDRIISIDGEPVRNWSTLRRKLSKHKQQMRVVYFHGTSAPGIPHLKLLRPVGKALMPALRRNAEGVTEPSTGLEPAELFVAHVAPGSPADLAGLKSGDLITKLDGEPIEHWIELDQRLQSRPDHQWTIEWRRYSDADKRVIPMQESLKQVRRKLEDEYGNTIERLVFGASNDFDRGRGEMVSIQGRFTYAVTKAAERTGETIGAMVSGFGAILAGNAPSDSMGGPLMMYRVASVSGRKGWETFLLMMALISVNLGLINLLPIPILDGGHLLMFAAEAVIRKPISIKTRERIHLAGLVLVGIITLLALRNDVMRYVIR